MDLVFSYKQQQKMAKKKQTKTKVVRETAKWCRPEAKD